VYRLQYLHVYQRVFKEKYLFLKNYFASQQIDPDPDSL